MIITSKTHKELAQASHFLLFGGILCVFLLLLLFIVGFPSDLWTPVDAKESLKSILV